MSFTSSEVGGPVFAPSLDSVALRLSRRAEMEDVRQAFSRLHWTDIRIDARIEPLFDDVFDLPDRLRGALGRALERARAAESEACDAWELLFGSRLARRVGSEFRPFVIQTESSRRELRILLRLLGFADCWTFDVAKACVAALRSGISIRSNGEMRVSLTPFRATSHRYWFDPNLMSGKRAMVSILTPLIVRSGANSAGSLTALASGALRRLGEFAAWSGVDIDLAARRGFGEWSIHELSLLPVHRSRRSSTHPDGEDLIGVLGRFVVGDLNERDCLLLRSLEIMHVGGRATAGYGRVRVAML